MILPNKTIVSLLLCSSMGYGLEAVADEAMPLNFSANLMWDYDDYDAFFLEGEDDEGESQSELRRANLGIKPKFSENWQGKLQIDFKNDETEVKDAYLKYRGLGWADVIIGQDKEPFGLENLTSSRNLMTIERSTPSNALSPGRNPGISLSGQHRLNHPKETFFWQLGYFQPDPEDESGTEARGDVEAFTGRLAWLPWRHKKEVFHLGLSASQRNYDGLDFRINERLEVHGGDSLLESKILLAEEQTLVGFEALWQSGPATVSGEWQRSDLSAVDGENYRYDGGYALIAYRLTGESRKYKNGVLGGLSPKSSAGAWELTYRWSEMNLEQEEIDTRSQTFGVNYYLNDKVKLMANYIKAELDEEGSSSDGDAVSLRVQFSF